MYYNLVVLLDGSDVSEVVLRYVPGFTRSVSAERITLLNVGLNPNDTSDDYLRDAATQLSETWGGDGSPLPEISHMTIPNSEASIAKTVNKYAENNDVDAIMLTTRGSSGADWWTTGSVAQSIIHGTHVPVFAARLRGGRYPKPDIFKKILVTLDGSLVSEQALPYAEHIAHEVSADLTLLHVLTTADSKQGEDAFTEEGARAYLLEISERLASVASRTTVDVRKGQPAQHIAGLAEEKGSDLIIMTTHGRTGPGGGAFGGVTEGVLHGCRIPLLIIPLESKVPEV